jgi:predicted amidohydrolase
MEDDRVHGAAPVPAEDRRSRLTLPARVREGHDSSAVFHAPQRRPAACMRARTSFQYTAAMPDIPPRTHHLLLPLLSLVIGLAGCANQPGAAPHAMTSDDSSPASPSRSLRIAVCQIFCIDGDKEGNFARIERALEMAEAGGADIACFPETCVLGWINPDAHALADPIPGPTTDRLAELAREYNLMIAIGLCEKDGEALYDSAVLINSGGAILLKHRKVNVLCELMDPPYTPGSIEEIAVVETEHGCIGMLVCADTFKDELVARIKDQHADLLLVPYGWAADKSAWPEHGDSLSAWVSATARRAGCPVVGTDLVGVISSGPWAGKTYGGQSPIANANGDILCVLADRDAEVRIVEIERADPKRARDE